MVKMPVAPHFLMLCQVLPCEPNERGELLLEIRDRTYRERWSAKQEMINSPLGYKTKGQLKIVDLLFCTPTGFAMPQRGLDGGITLKL